MTCWAGATVALFLLAAATLCASDVAPKRVLILDPFGHQVAPFDAVVSTFRASLVREFEEPLALYDIPLDLGRFAGPDGEEPLVAFLEGRLERQPMDLVVPVGAAAVQFAVRYRERLFRDTPALGIAGDRRLVASGFLTTNTTLVLFDADLPGMVEDILQMAPLTTNIVVVFGSSALERYWVNECRREFQVFSNRVEFTWLHERSVAQILAQCADLPPRSFILHGIFVVDVAGVSCEQNEVLRRLHATANAPVFAYFASEFGLGAIGGRLYPDFDIGEQGARTAMRILRGESPGGIPPQILEPAAPVYDWRELKRWGISEARLPPGSDIRFREPNFWELNRGLIAGAVVFCFLQSALIIGLLVNRAKRRQGEAEATLIAAISSAFVNLPPGEVDREILNAQRRICTFLGLDVSALWQWSTETPCALVLTHLYRIEEGPPPPERMDASEHFPWCQQELQAGRIIAVSSLDDLPPEAARDRETWRLFGIKTTLTIPLSVGGSPPLGSVSFNTTRAEREWPDVLVKRLQLVAQIFANALARKRSDQALHESEERMTLAAEAAKFGVWVWSVARDEIWGSDPWLRLFGFGPRDVIRFETVLQRIHPDDRATVDREVKRALADQGHYAGEFRVVLPDGTLRWIAAHGRLRPAAHGARVQMLGTAVDITARKGADEKFRLAVEASPNGIVLVDSQRRIVLVNAQTEALFGYARAELMGAPVEILIPEQYRGAHPGLASKYTAKPEARAMGSGQVLFARRKNGSQFPVEIGLSPIHSVDGLFILTVIVDITVRKRAETELLEQRAELAHLSRVTMLGELSGSIAHELNQPLTAILSNAQAAQRFLTHEPVDLNEVREILADIVAEDNRAGEVIRRLRLLLKKGEVQHDTLQVNDVVLDVLRLVRSDLVIHNFMLHTELSPDLPPIVGDRVQLQQVLLNLVMNAFDAMADTDDDRRLTISTMRADDHGVGVTVADCGLGISPEKLEQIFDPFYSTKPLGLGLGLAVCRTIITAHGGKLWATNNPRRGATLHVVLPIAEANGV